MISLLKGIICFFRGHSWALGMHISDDTWEVKKCKRCRHPGFRSDGGKVRRLLS